MPSQKQLQPEVVDFPVGKVSIKASIAAVAARLMAEDGITDFQHAKRKAARQLGLSEQAALPDNAEVQAELKRYLDLYRDEEDIAHLREMREAAVELMLLLEDYHPYLTGSALDGTATRHANIDLFLFADSAKEVEIFLLNHDVDFAHAKPRNEKAEAVLVVPTEVGDANLVIFPPQLERMNFKHRDGRVRERVRREAVEALLAMPE